MGMMMYQQVNLADHALVGAPGPLPDNLVGLSEASLADISAGNPDAPDGLKGQGWWPVATVPPASFDPHAQVIEDAPLAVDPDTRTVRNVQTVRAMTPAEFTAANPAPDQVSNYQARAILIAAGLFDKVDVALRGADMAVPQNKIALQAWDYANNFYRASPFVAGMKGALGLTDAQVDDLFRRAGKVT